MTYLLVTNPAAGPDEDELVVEARRRLGGTDVVELREDIDVGAAIRAAVAEERVVVASGGDGTVNLVLQHVVPNGIMGLLPSGTANHFARDLGLGDPDVALEALARRRVVRVDVGQVDGRYFANNVAIGLYPDLVREREPIEERWGRWLGHLRAAAALVPSARRLRGRIRTDDRDVGLLAWGVFVGNNRYRATLRRFGERPRLDEGVLDVRLVGARAPQGGRWKGRWFPGTTATEVQVRLSGPRRRMSCDGEIVGSARNVEARIVPGGLHVVVPSAR